jgi:hypothetical protein
MGHTLQPTELVHELYLQITGVREMPVIVFASPKGGAGKSTSAVVLARGGSQWIRWQSVFARGIQQFQPCRNSHCIRFWRLRSTKPAA